MTYLFRFTSFSLTMISDIAPVSLKTQQVAG
ncbi:Uncharacterised protein [Vibrio cholerae]|nr:Uncharacterised protein [Vibrio cholerae]